MGRVAFVSVEPRKHPHTLFALLLTSDGLHRGMNVCAASMLTRRRLPEIESGSVQGIPGDEVSARIRKVVGR